LALETILGYAEADMTDEDREFIRYMVDHAYWSQASSANDISVMISEEAAGAAACSIK